jgi:hypothetical protein
VQKKVVHWYFRIKKVACKHSGQLESEQCPGEVVEELGVAVEEQGEEQVVAVGAEHTADRTVHQEVAEDT